MKASELKPGDVMDGWTVTALESSYPYTVSTGSVVLLELELMGDVLHEGEDSTIQEVKRARTWYRSDEDVEVTDGEACGSQSESITLWRRRHAVVEAAKQWCDEHILGNKASINRKALDLASAVEALDSEEG